jgi:hypothetical protein
MSSRTRPRRPLPPIVPTDTAAVDAFEDSKEVLERAGQAIELPDDKRVAGAELIEQPMQFGAVPSAAGCHFLKQLLAAGLFESADLRRSFLANLP